MLIFVAVLIAFYLDLLFGDPPVLPHPVELMGKCIAGGETFLRRLFPKSKPGAFWAGLMLAFLLPLSVLLLTGTLCYWATRIHPVLGLFLQSFWCWQALASKGLRVEGLRVYHALQEGDLGEARDKLSRVARCDTTRLSKEGVVKATVETLSEKFIDVLLAPLLYMMIGGAPLALCYRSINTMDSMIGYKTERYRHFGCAAARLDDAVNYIPARLGAFLWIFASSLLREDAQAAFLIWRRDRRKCVSPNAAQTKAACAGALGIQLAGEAYYFGERYDNPPIGEELRAPEAGDIPRTVRMLYVASISGLLLLSATAALVLNI